MNGKEEIKNVNICAGIRDLKQDQETGCVEPIINWCIDFHMEHIIEPMFLEDDF